MANMYWRIGAVLALFFGVGVGMLIGMSVIPCELHRNAVQPAPVQLSLTPPDSTPAEFVGYFLGVTERGQIVVLDSRSGRVWEGRVGQGLRPVRYDLGEGGDEHGLSPDG